MIIIKKDTSQVTVGSVSPTEVLQMVERVKELYMKHVPEVEDEVLFHNVLKEEIDNPMNGDAAKKHLKQQVLNIYESICVSMFLTSLYRIVCH